MDTTAFNHSLILTGVGMAVLFLFMGLMILIIHYFQAFARRFYKK